MADDGTVVVIKLTIDNKEYEAKIDVSKGQIVDLIKMIDPLEQKFEQAYKSITSELMKYNSVTESSIGTLSEWLSKQSISLNIIDQTIQKLQTETKAMDVNTNEWKTNMIALDNLRASHAKMLLNYDQHDQVNKKVLPGQTQMNMALSQFGFALGDSSMILVNFRMALMGVGNNIPFIVQYFNEARKAAGGTATTMQLLTGAIAGGGGLIIGINGLMLLLQLLPELFDDNSEAIKNQGTEVDELKKKIKDLTATLKDVQKIQEQPSATATQYTTTVALRTAAERAKKIFEESVNTDAAGARKLTEEQQQKIIDSYVAEIDRLKKKESELFKILQEGDPTLTKYSERIEKIFDATTKYSGEALQQWLVKNGVMKDEIQATVNSLNEYQGKLVAGSEGAKQSAHAVNELNKAMSALFSEKDAKDKKNNFAQRKADAIADLLSQEMVEQTKEEILAMDYIQLLEKKEAAEVKLKEAREKIRSAETNEQLAVALAEEKLIEKQINIYERACDQYVKTTEEEIEASERKKEADARRAEEYKKWQEERNKFLSGFEAKGTADNHYEQRKNELTVEEELSIQRAEKYGATEEQITNIHSYYARMREDIERQSVQNQFRALSQGLNGIATLFNQHTLAYKAVKIAQAIIDTYSAANVALAAYPPPYNYIAVAGVIATGLENVQQITKTKTGSVGGYAEGGILPEGKAGIFEGTHNEIVAPEKDFIAVANELVARGQIAAEAAANGGSYNQEFMKEIKTLNDNFIKYADKTTRAYITQEDFNEAFNESEYQSRK